MEQDVPTFSLQVDEKTTLILRDVGVAEDFFLLVENNREEFRKWFPWVDTTLSSEDIKAFIEKCQKEYKEGKSLDLGVFHDGRWVGSMGFHTINKTNNWGEVGYWLDKDSAGKGIMTSCVKKIMEYGFGELNLHRIQIRCAADNLRSKAVAERLSFKHEGTVREDHKREDGSYVDGLIYGMLVSEWKKGI